MAIIDKHFAATAKEHSQWGLEWQHKEREKWSPNPLQRKPIVSAGDELIIPSPHLLINRITPNGLYFIGIEAFKATFTDALGKVFEQYVGDQLRELPGAEVHSEIAYGSHNEKSCDYIVVFAQGVVLVEVKTARPILDFRTGEDNGFADAKKKLCHARDQLNKTEKLIVECHPAFNHIPKDRPHVRLVVTLEPFFLRQTLAHEAIFGEDPVPVASAHDLEAVVGTLTGHSDAGQRMLTALTPRSDLPADLLDAMDGLEPVPNSIISDAWDRWAVWEHQTE